MILDDILREINNAEKICILSHENPDGDAIGSSLGLYNILDDMGKQVEIFLKKVPQTYSFLKGFEAIKEETETEKFDLCIVVDCPDIKRVCSGFIKYFENADVTVEFDHHISNKMFADYNVVNHVSPACSQILISSLDYLEIPMKKEDYTCFITGIITDTGGFRTPSTTVETFEYAGRALEEGINLSKVYKQSLLTMTHTSFDAQKIAMDRMEFLADGKVTFTYITKQDTENLGLVDGDHEGIVEIGRKIEGVEVSIFLHEEEKGFKISLRSNDYINVSEVCSVFGGGGHIRAAGAMSTMSVEETKKALLREIEKRLK